MPFVLTLVWLCALGALPELPPTTVEPTESAANSSSHVEGPSLPDLDEAAVDPQEDPAVTKVALATELLTPPQGQGEAEPSEGERIANLTRTIEAQTRDLEDMRAELDHPEGEYVQAEVEFKELDETFRALNKTIEDLDAEGRANEAEDRRAELKTVERGRTLAKERFDLAIEERRVLKQKIATLEQKLAQDQAVLDRLTGEGEAAPPAPATGADGTPVPPETPPPATAPVPTAPAAPATAAPASAPTSPAERAPPAATPPAVPGTMSAPAGAASPVESPVPPTEGEADDEPASEEMVEAQADAETKAQVAEEAERDAKSVAERMALLDASIEQARSLLDMARKKADNANETRSSVAIELQEKSVGNATPAELQGLVKRMREAEARFLKARGEVRERTDLLEEQISERSELLREQNTALRKAEEAKGQLDIAESRIESLKNPFALRNVLQWLLDHGPRLLAILVGMFLLQWSSKLLTRRVVQLISRGGGTGTKAEREDRAQTLVGVFRNAMSVIIMAGGILMVFQEIGIPIAPLMGGAAVIGLAVAFGAQNLIRDFFYGFVILLENQYKLNDVVRIGSLSGQVEQITLRMTVLRDLEGIVHFIPNGEITSVSNMTHGWSRALFEIGVAYKEDADRVMSVLVDLGRELRRDPYFGKLILEDPTMLGVDSLADSAVVIKFYIKTRPLKQWEIKRETLRRVKRRFDDLGIEIPFPHRTVYHRHDDGGDGGEISHPHDATPNIRVSG